MSAVMMDGRTEFSPRRTARLTGLFFLLTILLGVFAQSFISERLIVFGNASRTASNILANEGLFRLAFTIYLIEMSCQIVMTVLFYRLLAPVNRTVALLAVIFGLVGCTIKTLARLFFFAPLLVLKGTAYSSVFESAQLQGLALMLLEVNDRGAAMALAFFGLENVLEGWLMIKSMYFPRFLGVLGVIGGLGWLTFISPTLGYQLFLYVAGFGLLASVITIGYLLTVGLRERHWPRVAGAGYS
jgi:hypothetical protein